MARALAEGIWVFDRPFSVYGLAVGTRMTAVRLPGGGLFVHSPVELDPPTRRELDELGPVRHVVAPNKVHHLFAGPYAEAHPQAELHAAPGLAEKRRDLAFHHVLADDPPGAWKDELDQLVFRGMPYLNEVAFLHRRSRTLLLTDLAMNPVETSSLITRLWFRAMGVHGRFGVSRLVKSLVRDRAAARESLERILAWDFERVVVSHGVVLQRHGQRLLREAFDWLLGSS